MQEQCLTVNGRPTILVGLVLFSFFDELTV